MKRKMKIALGNLEHNVAGRHSAFMPVEIGYIASYALTNMDPKNVEIRFYADANVLLKDLENWKPDVMGLGNYCWNTELSCLIFRHAKSMNPNIVCVAGGPEFPTEPEECRKYLLERREIDFFAHREGEIAFTQLVKKIQWGADLVDLKSGFQGGMASIDPRTNRLVFGKPIPRLTDLDEIPSPYLTGLMEQWFNGCYVPSMQTARGCPYTCGYCKAGESWYTPVARFSVERVKEELDYIFEKIGSCPDSVSLLALLDSDFGMTKRDELIAEHIGALQKKHKWPNAFDVVTGKANYDRILRIVSILQNKLLVCAAIQSLNPKTLEAIRRKNLRLDQYQEIFKETKRKGMSAYSELILPLPEETKISFFESIRLLLEVGAQSIQVYTTMLLKGTPLASQEYRKKYGLKTKHRLLPKQFGQYRGEKCFEVEEVCVATNTLSFEDYLECRGFSLVLQIFTGEQFDFINRHLEELQISPYDFYLHLWELIKSGRTELSPVYSDFIKETEDELWDSRQSIYEYFSRPENYEKLISGELGDNLMRKYGVKMLIDGGSSVIDLVYSVIKNEAGTKLTQEIGESLDAANEWIVATRNLHSVIRNEFFRRRITRLHLLYDVNKWYLSATDSLISHKKPVTYEISYDAKQIEKILTDLERLHGEKPFAFGRFLMSCGVKIFWGKSKLL